jgi:hypothetical protein
MIMDNLILEGNLPRSGCVAFFMPLYKNVVPHKNFASS